MRVRICPICDNKIGGLNFCSVCKTFVRPLEMDRNFFLNERHTTDDFTVDAAGHQYSVDGKKIYGQYNTESDMYTSHKVSKDMSECHSEFDRMMGAQDVKQVDIFDNKKTVSPVSKPAGYKVPPKEPVNKKKGLPFFIFAFYVFLIVAIFLSSSDGFKDFVNDILGSMNSGNITISGETDEGKRQLDESDKYELYAEGSDEYDMLPGEYFKYGNVKNSTTDSTACKDLTVLKSGKACNAYLHFKDVDMDDMDLVVDDMYELADADLSLDPSYSIKSLYSKGDTNCYEVVDYLFDYGEDFGQTVAVDWDYGSREIHSVYYSYLIYGDDAKIFDYDDACVDDAVGVLLKYFSQEADEDEVLSFVGDFVKKNHLSEKTMEDERSFNDIRIHLSVDDSFIVVSIYPDK